MKSKELFSDNVGGSRLRNDERKQLRESLLAYMEKNPIQTTKSDAKTKPTRRWFFFK